MPVYTVEIRFSHDSYVKAAIVKGKIDEELHHWGFDMLAVEGPFEVVPYEQVRDEIE